MEAAGLEGDIREIPEIPQAAVVVLKGALDSKNVLSFRSWMEGLAGRGIQRLVLDLDGLKYVNSTGMAYLINLSESVTERSGSVTLTRIQPKVRIILETLGVLGFFKVSASPEIALGDLRKGTLRPAPSPAHEPGRKVPPAPPAAPARVLRARPRGRPRSDPEGGSPVSTAPPAPPAPAPRRRNPVVRLIRRVLGLR